MSMVYQAELDEFLADLDIAAGTTAGEVATQVIHSMGDEVASLGAKYAPRDTGELASSIAVYKGPLEARVKAEAPHAAYVEFGTWSHSVIEPKSGTYTIEPKKKGGVLRFTAGDGKTVYTRKVEHPGIKPNPFMEKATNEILEKFQDQIGNVGVILIMGQQ